MTDIWNSRLDVVEALEAAGWTGDPEYPLTLLRHPLGAVFGIHNEAGDCGLDTAGGSPVEFPGNIPDAVVIAACLAASHQDPTTALALELHEERQDHARTRVALTSAKRRARRRLPHEREGLIFHLERRNRRLEELVTIANAAADVTLKAGEEAAAEAYTLRGRVGNLQDRVRVLETVLGGQTLPCGRELSTGQPCPDHPRPEPAPAAAAEKEYGPALPWARLMDAEDLEEFLGELTEAAVSRDGAAALAELEATCGRWRAIAEAQHAHNTAPGPDAPTPA